MTRGSSTEQTHRPQQSATDGSANSTQPHRTYRGRLCEAVSSSAAPHGYTLALWTATAITSSERGALYAPDVPALLAGATLAFVALAAVAYGGTTMTAQRPGRDGPRIWAAFHCRRRPAPP